MVLEELRLRANALTAAVADALWCALEERAAKKKKGVMSQGLISSLTHLDLRGNLLGPAGCVGLARLLATRRVCSRMRTYADVCADVC